MQEDNIQVSHQDQPVSKLESLGVANTDEGIFQLYQRLAKYQLIRNLAAHFETFLLVLYLLIVQDNINLPLNLPLPLVFSFPLLANLFIVFAYYFLVLRRQKDFPVNEGEYFPKHPFIRYHSICILVVNIIYFLEITSIGPQPMTMLSL